MERQTYTYDEAFEASLQYFKGDELAARVWVNKYAVKDSFGNIFEKSPEDMHWRIANEVARIEAKYKNGLNAQQLYELLDHFKYIVPQGSPMTGIGNDFQVASLSNCFVIGIDGAADSYGGIIRIDEEQVQLMKRRGGVGHDLSHIRPKGSPVKNSALTSTGLVPFMERYSNSTREVAQDGRRGALMLSVSIKHPDSEAFIDAKMTEGKVTGANVSVKLDDAFMQAAVNGTPYKQQYPVDSDQPVFTKGIDASALWKKIVHNAWKSAEPGVLFWDTIIRESVPDCYADLGYRTVSTNPCGEIPLCPYDSCRLLAINLYSYVVNPYTKEAYFDFDLFKKHVALAQRIMDDIIDLELEKIEKIIAKIDSDPESEEVKEAEKHLWEKIYKKSGQGRRTGVGITAEGDMLAAMGLRYGTEEATEFSEQVHKTIALEAYRSSVNMAKERGAFAIYDSEREKNNPFINRLKEADPELYEEMKKYGRRNIACLTIAPTGTTSLMTQTTSGIEPVFMPVYKRRRKVNPNDPQTHVDFVDETGDAFEEYIVFHHKFVEWMTVNGYDPTKRYTQEEIDKLVEKSPYYKATSNDVDWLMKVKMQGRIQKWVDHSISVTINLPNDVDEALVNRLYVEAWRSGCKGCTVYRDGSRSGVLLSTQKDKKDKKEELPPCKPPTVVEVRPKVLEAEVVRFQNNKEKWVAFVGLLDGHPYEIFTGLQDDEEGISLPKSVTTGRIIKNIDEEGNKRYDFQFENKRGYKTTIEGLSEKFNKEYWNYAKLISGVLRWRMPIDRVIKLVDSLQLDSENINTWKNGVERALKKYVTDGTSAEGQKCPNCGNETLVYQEGCLICKTCGTSRCG
ncbi:adenosylcobalamin-dependent ribonucleoside-diphosphate reductase [Phocaeicola vulgatus]|uniref:adenosylcobalamin-dependent ribonucleoside-diphosphate reductase n=1 Tax=Phocaeicola vulgatus TaxID=821 RepID=UPI0018AB4C86|nr:adenosylcobalamin-dependent ribonucleoside-diphosphate reductase [Phocaeicola vulgatus]MCR1856147.1 adenosylcobalamin-dependent ribonucleoside-diphosphate reductase [Phocaeicola vulgatus]MDB0991302.1 adenosylcobalamin-dependent ribonucleoside-diphosphate reductase [Phocaeicola vulgatus]MDB1013232.1 adenosylcobalamin-dependent ribonucleoside-diphosphate reductase [Phocaeicola vulgatus]MDB1017667.1 adenosylcobalamin-dependent ribonucleoside-diphosphate reductase [Phocaeicola vulgatus]MDB10258